MDKFLTCSVDNKILQYHEDYLKMEFTDTGGMDDPPS